MPYIAVPNVAAENTISSKINYDKHTNKISSDGRNCNLVKWYLLPDAEALRMEDNFLPFVDICTSHHLYN
jgi:hypothetical protein